MWPLVAAFPERAMLEDSGKSPYADRFSTVWLELRRSRLALCSDCIKGDLRDLHFSFWRRSHQVPGQFHCQRHKTELLFVARPIFLKSKPDELVDGAQAGEPSAVSAAAANPVALRTLALLLGILGCTVTVPRSVVMESLRQLALVRTHTTETLEAIRTLSLQIAESIPGAWLRELMPLMKSLGRNGSAFVRAGIQQGSLHTSAASVALVTAFPVDSSDEGLAVLLGQRSR
jgi:hypothetical protein